MPFSVSKKGKVAVGVFRTNEFLFSLSSSLISSKGISFPIILGSTLVYKLPTLKMIRSASSTALIASLLIAGSFL